MVDSKAVFLARARAIGVQEATLQAMERRGWDTLGGYAFSCAYTPGAPDDAILVNQVMIPLLGRADHAGAPALRRLFYESFTMIAADLKHRAERSDDAPRRMPNPERHARYLRVVRKLSNFEIAGAYEPANSVIDAAAAMIDEGIIKYIAWDICITRDQELLAGKKDKSFRPDSTGHLQEHIESKFPQADLTTDLKLQQALFRRGVACEIAQLMTYSAHDKIVQLLLRELHQEVPPGYKAISYAQILRADVMIFRRMAELTRGGLDPDERGELPTDKAVNGILLESRVLMLLSPLPSGSSAAAAGTAAMAAASAHDEDEVPVKPKAVAKTKAKAKAKSKAKASSRTLDKSDPKGRRVLPKGLSGSSRNSKGEPLCFGFNTKDKGCPDAVPGAKCARGWHSCMVCGGNHGVFDCKKVIDT
jgi:hypothetical protein